MEMKKVKDCGKYRIMKAKATDTVFNMNLRCPLDRLSARKDVTAHMPLIASSRGS